MTEPVGNRPRKGGEKETPMSGLTGNSHKSRTPDGSDTTEREPVEKMVEGRVISRKPPWYKRVGRNFIAEDAGHVGEYILMDVVVPATKNLILDMISQTTERVLFGTTRGRVRRSPLGASLREQVNYGRYSEREVRRPIMSREARARHDFNEIVLEHRDEAFDALEFLVARIARYGSATVADLYDSVGVTSGHADRNWGWTDLNTADIRQVPGGFLLDLPGPEPINR